MRYVFIWVFPDFLDTLYVLLHLFKKNNDFNLYLSNISCTKKMLYSGHGSKVKFAVLFNFPRGMIFCKKYETKNL
jgi:hypothetical protein